MSLDQRISRESFVYAEVARLYRIARELRPTTLDRWNGELSATSADTMGGLHPKTGALKLSGDRVLRHLSGSVSRTEPSRQAQALATVLHEATHGGMEIDAPAEPNAVRSDHSYGLTEGFAEVRAFTDFPLFTKRAGYRGLTLDTPQYPGAFVATRDLMAHVTGPAYSRDALISDACRGPGVMHFDQFAHAVVVNRLGELVQGDVADRQAIRRTLIEPMLHAHWPTLPKTSAETGQVVAQEIRSALDAKVDELRRTYRFTGPGPVGGDQSRGEPGSPDIGMRTDPATADTALAGFDSLRFLAANAPAAGAVGQRPTLGQGARGATADPGLRTRSGQSTSRPRC